jgi:diadenosine tetraphosphatase ApaH/serine/threonine PP2A family protein phosphatase
MNERIGLFADVHSNLEALEACLERARTLQVTRMVFLGDLVGYNADPRAVVDRVAELVDAGRAIALMGNHDQAIFTDHSRMMNPVAWSAIQWTREQLSTSQVQFLQRLPMIIHEDDTCFVHASAYQPENWRYVNEDISAWQCAEHSGKTYTFVGHVHEPMLFYQTEIGKLRRFAPHPGKDVPIPRHRTWVGVIGSLGQPRDGIPEACFAVFEPHAQTISFQRVPYDFHTAAQKIRHAGLDPSLADRLITGQ